MSAAFILGASLLGAVTLSSSVDHLEGLAGATAVLELGVADEQGRPALATSVRLSTSVGEVSQPRQVDPHRWSAELRLTRSLPPQVALLGAVVERDGRVEVAFLALPVHGVDHLELRTKPQASVSVTVGKRTFGPAVADARGRATVPVEVPPGQATAQALSVDRLGNRRSKPVDLEPKPFPRVAAVVARAEPVASWADVEPTRVELFVVRPDGQPATAGPPPTVEVSHGSSTRPEVVGPGRYRLAFRAPERLTGGEATLTFSLAKEQTRSTLPVALKAGPPARLELRPDSSVHAAGAPPLAVRVLAFDAKENGVPVAEGVRLSADFGEVRAEDSRRFALYVPEHLAGRSASKLRVEWRGLSSEHEVRLVPGPARVLRLVEPSTRARPGELAAVSTVEVLDSYGNPVPEGTLRALGSTQRVGLERLDGARWRVRFDANQSDEPGPRLLALGLEGEEEPLLEVPLEVLPSRLSLGVHASVLLGAQTNTQGAHGAGPAVEVGLRLPRSSVGLFAHAGLVRFLEHREPYDWQGQTYAKLTRFEAQTFGLGARYAWPLGRRFDLDAVLGGGALRTAATLVLEDSGFAPQPSEQWSPWARGGLGVSYRLGPGQLVGEASVAYGPVRGALAGGLGGPGLALGYRAQVW